MTAACYRVRDVLALLQMSERTFFRLKAEGKLPYLEEIRPRSGRALRFRRDLIDQYLAGDWGRPSLVFGRKRRA
jgi:predicted DNA-binding transcriptional regulator AlpA